MSLDIGTLGLVLLLVYAGNGLLAVFMAWSGRSFPGSWLWVGGQAVLALGALAMFNRPLLPLWVSVVLGNSAYVSASLLFGHAVWSFRTRRPFPRWLYALIPLVLVSFWAVFDESFVVRARVFSFWAAVGAGFTALVLIWRVQRPYRLATVVTALPFLAVAVASVVRLFLNSPGEKVAEEFYQQYGVNGLYMVGSILTSTFTLFGYFMMSGLREQQAMGEKDAAIEARNRRLLESNRAKDLFFSVIAHDLRGPIGGAARYVRKHLLGKMTGLEAKFTEVETLASALDKTNEFLEKLLWWSRAQLQDWSPSRAEVDLEPVLEQTLSLVRSAADVKEIQLVVPPGPFPRPWADPESVQLILGNFLSNAVKFSLPGRKIVLQVEEEYGLCRVTVVDEGVGMDPTTLDRLFRIEDKLSTHGTSGERGSGLGLLLARSLAERNNGGITIDSTAGVGTRATLWLPTTAPGAPS